MQRKNRAFHIKSFFRPSINPSIIMPARPTQHSGLELVVHALSWFANLKPSQRRQRQLSNRGRVA
jgi:hypothetical protein